MTGRLRRAGLRRGGLVVVERETGIEIPDDLVRDSNHGCEVACELLSLISKGSNDQDRPVFVPLRNGKVIEVTSHYQANQLYENYHVVM